MQKYFGVFFCLLLLYSTPSLAQPSTSPRSLVVEQLSVYGQAIYDRGDYVQAAQIFSKILSLDPQNKKALYYADHLKKKGQIVLIPVQPPAPVVTKEKVIPVAVPKKEIISSSDPN